MTDSDGDAYQFFLYLPWGESLASQKVATWSTPYQFNGKELDSETGFYDYGARYYDPSLSIWLAVDPLADKMPSWSPYTYTFNNPINLIDPDGRMPTGPGDPKPTIISMRYGYNIRSSNIPFLETFRSASGSFTELTGLTVTDISLGEEGGGYIMNISTPRAYPHNRDNPSYTTQSFSGADLENMSEVDDTDLAGAFLDGMKVGMATAVVDEAFNGAAFLKYKVPSRFKVKASNKGGGIRFIDPKNKQNEIRMMSGNPKSPHVSQQSAYVKYRHNGTYYDVNGNAIKSAAGGGRSGAAHIPLKDYNPSVMPKFD